jgi:hypothetical protein
LNESIARFTSLGTAELAERKSKPGLEREHCEVHIIRHRGASEEGNRNQCLNENIAKIASLGIAEHGREETETRA